MPVFFQHQINESTRLGVWKIEETEEFFKGNVPIHREVTHPHKRLQHLAGRFLLQYLFPDFPYQLIEIADTRKPFLPGEQYHFSISHCGDFAAAIVSKNKRVGIDVEIPVDKIGRIMHKYLSTKELGIFNPGSGIVDDIQSMNVDKLTLLWSSKEAVFKWHGNGGVDFRRDIRLFNQNEVKETIECFFSKKDEEITIQYRQLDGLVLAWVV